MTGVGCGAAEGQVIHHSFHCDVGTELLEKRVTVKPVLSDHIKQDIFLAFITGGCLL